MRAFLVILSLLSGCAALETPGNRAPVAGGAGYQAQYRDPGRWLEAGDPRLPDRPGGASSSGRLNADRCAPQAPPVPLAPAAAAGPSEQYSRGDLLRVETPEDGVFSGLFEISQDGMLRLPHLPPVPAQGRDAVALAHALRQALVTARFYDRPGPDVAVGLSEMAPARVAVSGAVFEPGIVEIGLPADAPDLLRQKTPGAATDGRNLSVALRFAGGVRPDADLARVALSRNGVVRRFDLRGALTGAPIQDVVLLAGDRVKVPSRGCFQEALVTPSAVTRAGVTTFLSNLTAPALSNANSAIGRETRDMAYGTRFSQAVFATNCMGGAAVTHADRYAVLLTRDPVTGGSIVIERRLERLLRRDLRDDFDPFIMPGDSLACYDSAVTNLAQVADMLGAVLSAGAVLAATAK